jgi:hypothetical protein
VDPCYSGFGTDLVFVPTRRTADAERGDNFTVALDRYGAGPGPDGLLASPAI